MTNGYKMPITKIKKRNETNALKFHKDVLN